MRSEPKTLQQAIIYFSDPDNCLNYLVARRWPKGVTCPTCGSKDVSFVPSRRVWQCKIRHSKCQFSVKVGTVFEDSPITLDKWLCAMWMLANCKNGVSSYEIARTLGVTQKTAWFMLHRIRLALQSDTAGKLSGEIEVDETFIGGKARNMHKSKRERLGMSQNRSMVGKVAVMGLLQRHAGDGVSQIRTQVIDSRRKRQLRAPIENNVEVGSNIYTDALRSYNDLRDNFVHQVIDHAESYADGQIHTNGLENFWSPLKHGISGTYISVEPFHLFRYLDEQVFRYNNRKALTDTGPFDLAISKIIGERLTYAEVTGKVGETTIS